MFLDVRGLAGADGRFPRYVWVPVPLTFVLCRVFSLTALLSSSLGDHVVDRLVFAADG